MAHQHSSPAVGPYANAEATSHHWRVVGTVCIGAFMAALDASIVNIALPTLQHQFHVSMSLVAWVSLSYLLSLAAVIVPLGRLADLFGRSKMYMLGFIVFAISSALCGWAPGIRFLLIVRVIQAIGAGMLQANSVSIITAHTPAHHRGKAIGLQASAQGIGLSVGPTIGGVLLMLNWRWIFFVNIPVGIIGTLLGLRWLPKDNQKTVRETFDFGGALILAPVLVAIIYVLNTVVNRGIADPYVLGALVIAVLGTTIFILMERRAKYPLIDLSLFKNFTFLFGNVAGVLSFTVMYAVIFLSPFYLERVAQLRSVSSGLYLTVIPVGMAVATPLAGLIADKLGSRLPMMIGMVFAMGGSLLLTQVSPVKSWAWLVVGLFLVGAGLGLFTPPNNAGVMGSVAKERLGVAGGILNMSRTLGMSIGVSLGGLLYESFLLLRGTVESSARTSQMLFAFHWSFVVLTAVGAITLLVSMLQSDSKA